MTTALPDTTFPRTALPSGFWLQALLLLVFGFQVLTADVDAVFQALLALAALGFAISLAAHLWTPRQAVLLTEEGVENRLTGVLVPWSAIRSVRARRVLGLTPMVELALTAPVEGIRGGKAQIPTINLETSAPALAEAIQRRLPFVAPVVH
ncbi:MAG: hypothetical protein AAFX62_07775 [Pseudomonadota bacterium]